MTTTPHPAPAEYRDCRLVVGAQADTLTLRVPVVVLQRAAAAVTRARAQGIGGEREKNNG
mgnify:CR=1 FL=1